MQTCSNFEDYSKFTSEYDKFINLERNELQTLSGCLRPCLYMEYKLADVPIAVEDPGRTTVELVLASSTVTLSREQYDFDFRSLVADVGGVLGLFIGINFLQLCETFIIWSRKFHEVMRKFRV